MRTRTVILALAVVVSGTVAWNSLAKAPPGRFTVNVVVGGSDTVTDTVTKLEWERGTLPAMKNWQGAYDQCDVATTGNKSDWRLPTARELESILDLGEANPAIDGTAFPGCKQTKYWTASDVVGQGKYFVVDFGSGAILTQSGADPAGYVRCVRGP
jgi:hypothetical protein